MTHSFDITIIGGGSAGYAAARTAISLGARTAVVDNAETLGGLCILRGCMPTKAILESSRRWYEIRHASKFGLKTSLIGPDLKAIMRRKKTLIDDFASYRQRQLLAGKFTLFRSCASFLNPHQIELKNRKGTEILESKAFILATGSRLQILPIPGLQESGFLTSDTALEIQKLPRSITVLGGGAVALEFAQFFADLGVKTTVIQRSSHLIRDFDPDVSGALRQALEKQGIRIFTETELIRIQKNKNQKEVVFRYQNKNHSVVSEEIFYGLGRVPQLSGLQLDQAKVLVQSGKPKVNAGMQTAQKHIFAAGDVTGLFEVVHIAIQQGEIAAHNAHAWIQRKSIPKKWNNRLKTSVVFTHPEVALVGATEAELQQQKVSFKTAQHPFADHGKSMIHGETDGFMKLLSETKSGKILGATIVGPHASELIHELVAVMYFKGTARDIALIPHYHPTLAEMITYPAEELAGI